MKKLERSIKKLLDPSGNRSMARKYKRRYRQYKKEARDLAVELDDIDIELIKSILINQYSMTNVARLVNTVKSCRYVVENKIPGDFVECGVWRGGNGILAKKVFDRLGSNKKVWMFDTFAGMTAPTDVDIDATNKMKAEGAFHDRQKETLNEWCYASLEDVKNNCMEFNLNLESFEFIKGDVCKTLQIDKNIPKEISVLRLDTDWYESTKAELEVLYPKLSNKGVLIIDDYGHWEGSRKAVDEYFSSAKYKPLFNMIDYTGRSAIKID